MSPKKDAIVTNQTDKTIWVIHEYTKGKYQIVPLERGQQSSADVVMLPDKEGNLSLQSFAYRVPSGPTVPKIDVVNKNGNYSLQDDLSSMVGQALGLLVNPLQALGKAKSYEGEPLGDLLVKEPYFREYTPNFNQFIKQAPQTRSANPEFDAILGENAIASTNQFDIKNINGSVAPLSVATLANSNSRTL